MYVVGSHPLTAGPIGSCGNTGRHNEVMSLRKIRLQRMRWQPTWNTPSLVWMPRFWVWATFPCLTAFWVLGHVEISFFKSTAINILCEHIIHCKKNKRTQKTQEEEMDLKCTCTDCVLKVSVKSDRLSESNKFNSHLGHHSLRANGSPNPVTVGKQSSLFP